MEGRRPGLLPLWALAAIIVVTVVLWALAFWPVAGASPEWLTRTRVACFRLYDDGLPDLAAWIGLIAQPIGMLAVLFGFWGQQVRAGLRALSQSIGGRSVIFGVSLFLAVGAGGVVVRVASAGGGEDLLAGWDQSPYSTRLDREAPRLALVDQSGTTFRLDDFRGRPILITFAYAHCETVCPLLVSDLRIVQEAVREEVGGGGSSDLGSDPRDLPVAVVVTLDPWRDTPSRLPAISTGWGLGEDAFVLSGTPDEVLATLDAWGVDHWRDERTGDIAHPALVYIVDREGRIAYETNGGVEPLLELLREV